VAGPVGFEGGHIVGEAGSHLEDELGITQVGVGPDLRYSTPMFGAAEKGSDGSVGAELSTPGWLGPKEAGHHRLVVDQLGVLAVEADLEGEDGCPAGVLAPDDLRLVVLPGWLLGSEPNLDAVAVVRATKDSEILRHQPPHRVCHILEQ